jgi:hypothetical protein
MVKIGSSQSAICSISSPQRILCYPIWTDRMKVHKNIIAPCGRIARPLGVKAQCDYCKVGFSFITGQVISVSGGLTMHG